MTPDQLEQLILTHQRSLELFASQWTNSPEDCVQEAFLRIHRQEKRITNEAAWLFRVVRNLAIDQGRSDASRTNREQTAGRRRLMFISTVNQVIGSDELEQAVLQLPEKLREIIVARLWGKLTLEEISESFGIAVSTAHRRYQQGIQSLQNHFEISCQKPNNQ